MNYFWGDQTWNLPWTCCLLAFYFVATGPVVIKTVCKYSRQILITNNIFFVVRLSPHGPPWTKPKNREIKLDITWYYVKRQTAKMKLLASVFSSLNRRVKIFVFVANSRRHFSIFMWFNERLEEKKRNSEVIFAVDAVWRKTMRKQLHLNHVVPERPKEEESYTTSKRNMSSIR